MIPSWMIEASKKQREQERRVRTQLRIDLPERPPFEPPARAPAPLEPIVIEYAR
jgi:hypothetical protein